MNPELYIHKFLGGSILEFIGALFGSKCSGSNIIDDFVTSYQTLTQNYNDEISNNIDNTLRQFKKMTNDFYTDTQCMRHALTQFPFLPPLPLASEFLLAARLASQFDCSKEDNCPEDAIHTSKMASFRAIKEILKKLWLEEPTPTPIGEDCEKGKRKLNSPTFTELSLTVQNQAIGSIENDCFRPLSEKYNVWYTRYPEFPENDCTTYLYGRQGVPGQPYCKGE